MRLSDSVLRYGPAALFITLALIGSVRADPADVTQMPPSTTGAKKATGDRVEAHINKLHAELRITPAQEDLWKMVVQVMRENENTMDALHRSRAQHAATMTAVDDVRSYAAIADAHADGLKKFVSVFEALYNSMSDEQKKNADSVLSPDSAKSTKHLKSRGR
ncbi:MAG TPA: Spy/CpxP family protein refolding chaperone [Nitrospira sp.]|nr:Spy/CpxP family protein refolding chaperone [Nitrospira sp.]